MRAMTPPRDPAGLIERIPELAALADHPSVRRAIERGDAHAVYRALFFGKLFGALRGQREVVETLLAQRRLFLQPLKKAPWLFTVNGVGASVYGSSERDDNDGSFIKTYFLVLVFVPIFPLAQYLVFAGERGNSWSFVGKVPLSPILYFWRRLMSLGVVAAVLFSGISAFQASRHNELYVINGLPLPVQVMVGKQALFLEAERRGSLTVDVGDQPIEVTTKAGRLVERGTVQVEGGIDVLAWNIAGAAPLYRDYMVYEEVQGAHASPEPDIECGHRQVVFEEVDYAFSEPPATMSMKKGAVKTVSHVDVAPGGAYACLSALDEQKNGKEQLALARTLAEVGGYSLAATTVAAHVMEKQQGLPAALAWVKGLRDERETLELHRIYQDLMKRADRREQALAEYQARLTHKPEDPDAAYLVARLLPNREALAMTQASLSKHPEHVPSLRSLVFTSFNTRRFADALEGWQRIAKASVREADDLAMYAAISQAALGMPTEALATLDKRFEQAELPGERRWLIALYARIAQALPGEDLFKLQGKLGAEAASDQARLWLRVRIGADLPEADLAAETDAKNREALTLLWLTARDAQRALAKVEASDPAILGGLDSESWLLLYAEALRRDPNSKAAQTLASWSGSTPALSRAVAQYLAGGNADDPELQDLDPTSQAVLQFVRSRRPDLKDAERTSLKNQAMEGALPGILTRAMSSWDA
jgi:hypothetical protein